MAIRFVFVFFRKNQNYPRFFVFSVQKQIRLRGFKNSVLVLIGLKAIEYGFNNYGSENFLTIIVTGLTRATENGII